MSDGTGKLWMVVQVKGPVFIEEAHVSSPENIPWVLEEYCILHHSGQATLSLQLSGLSALIPPCSAHLGSRFSGFLHLLLLLMHQKQDCHNCHI